MTRICTTNLGGHWGVLLAVALSLLTFFSGCALLNPLPPGLVPLPASRMPKPKDLASTRQRLIIVPPGETPHASLEQSFLGTLQHNLQRYGILTLSGDSTSQALIGDLLRRQAQSGQEATIRDPQYEMLQANGLLSVRVLSAQVLRHNERRIQKDKEGREYPVFRSEYRVGGVVSLTLLDSGASETLPFSQTMQQISRNEPHRFEPRSMAVQAIRRAADSRQLCENIAANFPLEGYVIGTGLNPRYLKINRGARQGVKAGRQWALILPGEEMNELVGALGSETVIGTAKTIEVQSDYCLVKCSSRATRLAAKLGMKARAQGFGLSIGDLLEDLQSVLPSLPLY
jgi:hypothetical protein